MTYGARMQSLRMVSAPTIKELFSVTEPQGWQMASARNYLRSVAIAYETQDHEGLVMLLNGGKPFITRTVIASGDGGHIIDHRPPEHEHSQIGAELTSQGFALYPALMGQKREAKPHLAEFAVAYTGNDYEVVPVADITAASERRADQSYELGDEGIFRAKRNKGRFSAPPQLEGTYSPHGRPHSFEEIVAAGEAYQETAMLKALVRPSVHDTGTSFVPREDERELAEKYAGRPMKGTEVIQLLAGMHAELGQLAGTGTYGAFETHRASGLTVHLPTGPDTVVQSMVIDPSEGMSVMGYRDSKLAEEGAEQWGFFTRMLYTRADFEDMMARAIKLQEQAWDSRNAPDEVLNALDARLEAVNAGMMPVPESPDDLLVDIGYNFTNLFLNLVDLVRSEELGPRKGRGWD